MRAAIAEQGALTWVDRPVPQPGPGEVRLRIAATAVNRADLVQVAGRYPPPPGATDVLGLECAGVVDAVGAGVAPERVGERVAALLSGGGYADYVCCPADHLLPVPDDVPLQLAATLPEVWITAWLNLIHEGGLAAGERVLLHAGASGVGTAGIQLARFVGAESFVVVGSADKLTRCQELGASDGVNRHEEDWTTRTQEWTGGRGFDLILDPVGADTVANGLLALAPRGRLVLIGLMSGRVAEIDLARVLSRRLRVQGSVLRGRSQDEKTALIGPFRETIWPALMRRELAPVVEQFLPLEDAAAAHKKLASNQTTGKIGLIVASLSSR